MTLSLLARARVTWSIKSFLVVVFFGGAWGYGIVRARDFSFRADACVFLFLGLACLVVLDALSSKPRFQVGRVYGDVILMNV